jgi:hypothetical protein
MNTMAVCCDSWAELHRETVDENYGFDELIVPEIARLCHDDEQVYVIAIGRKGMDYLIGTSADDLQSLTRRARSVAEALSFDRIYMRHSVLDIFKYTHGDIHFFPSDVGL